MSLQFSAAGVFVGLALALVLLVASAPSARAASSPQLGHSPVGPLQVSPPVQPEANPPLPLSCSGSFALVFDTSGSFTQGNLDSVASDAKAFVEAVLDVDSSASFRIAHFSDSSGVTEAGSSNLGVIEAAIDAIPNVGGFTNWAAGISAGAGVDHLIVMTDGNPNRPGATTEVNDTAVSAAIEAANAAKLGGAHITVIGIDTSGSPPAGFDASSVMRAGWVASPDAVFTTTVGLLPSILDDIASNCLTSVELHKEVEGGGPLSAGDFDLRLDGNVVTQGVMNEVDPGAHAIGEDAEAQYELVGISCVDEQQNEVTVTDGSINVADQQNVVCTLTNRFVAPSISIDKQVNGGDDEIAVPAGTTVTYSWVVENTGNVTLTNVLVDDDTHDVLDADCGTLEPGDTCDLEVEVQLDDVGDITNIVTVTTDEGPDDSDEITVEVYQPTITLVKVSVIGGELETGDFQLTLDGGNVEQGVANDVSPGAHSVGEVAVESYNLSVLECRDENQSLLESGGGQLTIEDERAVVCEFTNVFVGTPHVSIDKKVNGVDGPILIELGDTVTYTWTVINDGDLTLTNVTVDDDTHHALDANCGTLAVGASCQGTADVTFNSDGSVTNIITVTTDQEVSDSDQVTVNTFERPDPLLAHITIEKHGGEEGVSYDFRLTHGMLDVVDEFSLMSGESVTKVLFQAADWSVVELNAPDGAVSSGTCQGDDVKPLDEFTCIVTNPTAPVIETLGSSLIVEKQLTSSDPASVSELVTFEVTVTASGDSDIEDVTVIDTFEHGYLEFVSASESCTPHSGIPDAAHGTLECPLGTLSPGTPGDPGEVSRSVSFTFRAIAATTPDRTVNSATAFAGDLPIGPAEADVEIIEVLGVQLPPAGDGSLASPVDVRWALGLAVAAVLATWWAIGQGLARGRRY